MDKGSAGASTSSSNGEERISAVVTEGNSSPQSTSGANSPARLPSVERPAPDETETPPARTRSAPRGGEPSLPVWATRAWDLQGPAPTIIDAARAAAEMSRIEENPTTAAEASAAAAAARGERPIVPSKPRGKATTAAARVAAQREKAPLRKGKWTQEEELFTAAVIREFERGMLACPAGTTLRSYLSEKLHCDPMRITKKFAGDASIGKRVFTPCKQTPELQEEARRVRAELRDMERRFAAHLQHASLAYAASSALKGRGRAGSLSALHRRPRFDAHRAVAVDHDGRLLQRARGPSSLKRARDDASRVAPDPQDSQLLLDFFVAVRERCSASGPEAAAASAPRSPSRLAPSSTPSSPPRARARSDGGPEAADAPPPPPPDAVAGETKDRSDSCATRPRTPTLPNLDAPEAMRC
ncbi:unnamed protein product [Pelagomonas calceolata]|uniref:Uncharacterized protein n=1 Tax=Pelagomonas calceolata TaxID=35677 RepID=A0A8J2SN29_9STRA|nr:unnamed protein product [Pelagomonas calceolata]